jgi:amino acid adenylation domain-containing protein
VADGTAEFVNGTPAEVNFTPSEDDGRTVKSVLEMFTGRVALAGNACAVEAEGETLTYAELDCQANILAAHLRALGVSRNHAVAVCLKRSPAMIVSLLAVWKAGAGYLALDPAYPPERLAFMLKDCGARVLLAQAETAQQLALDGIQFIDPTRPAPARGNPELDYPAEAGTASPDDPAYVIYTSGSTGLPKGVAITHRNLLNLIEWHCKAFAVSDADRAPQLSSPAFDAAVWEIWPTLVSGASLHLPDEEVRSSPERLRDWMIAHEITIAFVPTVMAEAMIRLDWPRHAKLRTMLTGGDVLHRRPPAGLPFRLVNNYGPTECTVVTTSAEVLPEGRADGPPAIGHPIPHVAVHILDETLAHVPHGRIGEIYIGGRNIGVGYVNRPELTAERFIPDPFAAGGWLYRTGDLGSILPDGQVSFHGRADDQVKIRGYRIEPQEIVAALNTHPDVRASAVVAQESGFEEKTLVAYLVAPGARPTCRSLVQQVREKLPDYMVPGCFVMLDALPLTASGKLDRRALPIATEENAMRDEDLSEPRTIIESHVAAILQELLRVKQVGREDNFFMLGGHSLLGTQVIAKVRDTFHVDLQLRTLFESPTVSALSAEIEALIVQNLRLQSSGSLGSEVASDGRTAA